MASGARLACESGREGRRSRGETAAGGHAPRVALDVGGGTEAVGGRLRQWPRREDLRGRYRVDERGMGESEPAPSAEPAGSEAPAPPK